VEKFTFDSTVKTLGISSPIILGLKRCGFNYTGKSGNLALCFQNWYLLASCLTNAQPLPSHRHAADDNSLIGCTSHDLTDDWSHPMPISLTASVHFAACLGAFEPDLFDHNVPFDNTTPIYLINLPWN